MSDDNIVDLKLRMQQKDLAELSEHILNKAIRLTEKNRELQEKIDHLEELLKKVDVIDLTKK